jgi:hypothetical protein
LQIHYRQGRENTVADVLSQRPDYKEMTTPEGPVLQKDKDRHLIPIKRETAAVATILDWDKHIREIHKALTAGHLGLQRLLDLVYRRDGKEAYKVQDLKIQVKKVLAECEICGKIKKQRHKPYRKL